MTDHSTPDGAPARDSTGAVPFAPDDRPVGITDVELAVFGGEAVLFDVQASMVHHLNAVAGATWLCCDGETSVARDDRRTRRHLLDYRSRRTGRAGRFGANSLEQFATQGLLVDRPIPRFTTTLDPVLADDGTEILPAPSDP